MLIKKISAMFAIMLISTSFVKVISADISLPEEVDYMGGALNAPQTDYYLSGEVTLNENTTLTSGNRLIINNGGVLTLKSAKLELSGNLEIKEGGKLYVEKDASIDFMHTDGASRIDGLLYGRKGSNILVSSGNIVVTDKGKIFYNGNFNESENVGEYKFASLGKISKGKFGERNVNIVKKTDKNFIIPEFPDIMYIDKDAKELRFNKKSIIDSMNSDWLNNISELHNLEKLELYGGAYLENLNMIKDLKNLKTLDLHMAVVSDFSALEKIESLENVIISFINFEDITTEQLSCFKNVKTIDLSRTLEYDQTSDEFKERIKEIKETLPDVEIIYGNKAYTKIYDSFYGKIVDDGNYRNRFKLCDKDGNIISDYIFTLYTVNYFYTPCIAYDVTVYFNKQTPSNTFSLKEDDIIKIYYDYRDTNYGLTVEEIAEIAPEESARIESYRIELI